MIFVSVFSQIVANIGRFSQPLSRWGMGLIASVIVLVACGGSGSEISIARAVTDASPPDQVPERPGGAFGFTHFVFEQVDDQLVTSLVEGPRGPQVRVPVSFPGLQQALASSDAIPEDLQMNRAELADLVGQLESVRVATEKYRDRNIAFADGYVQIGGVVPNMGAHLIHPGRVNDGILNLEEPEVVLYYPDETGEWRLAGTAFILPRSSEASSATKTVGDEHPEGFAGPLDNWHVHYQLCTFPDGRFQTLSEETCQDGGGIFVESFGWIIHAWVHDDNPLGVFSMWNPNVPPLAAGSSGIRFAREAGPQGFDGEISLTIENFGHSTLEIQAGQAVTWLNADGVPHTVTSDTAGDNTVLFDSTAFGPGQTFTYRFEETGRFAYTCTIHPQMKGLIIVK